MRTWFLVSKPFQSTLPARGSDSRNASANVSALSFQSTLPARGSDLTGFSNHGRKIVFQSTLPARGSDHFF